MKKIVIIAAASAVVLAGAIGGTVAFMTMRHHSDTASPAAPPPPKPIYFAQLNDLVVSIPADTNDSTTSYIQITIQFSTLDQNAVATFTNLQPIIKAQIINLLMTMTAKSLTDPSTHDALSKNCVDIANKVLNTSANYTPPNPFTAAYITNLVEQN